MNSNLTAAKRNKNDEFYTQLSDIERELYHYRNHFKGKVVYCNCDDPMESSFFEYFAMNFKFLGLKKLITSCYRSDNPAVRTSGVSDTGVWLEYNGELDGTATIQEIREKVTVHNFEGDGDFRSEESINLLKEADIVVTNPPFSLFREYVAQLIEYGKKFLIIGNSNAITYKEIFPLLKDNRMWLGKNSVKEFLQPDGTVKKFGNIGWFTNLDHSQRHEDILLFRKYNERDYPKYDNYDAIEVSRVANIPKDYDGVMGVPITFLDKYNPEQFEILGLTTGRYEFGVEAHPTKRYVNAKQHSSNGRVTNGSKANTRATLSMIDKPEGTYYTADNADGYLKIVYARILIKKKG